MTDERNVQMDAALREMLAEAADGAFYLAAETIMRLIDKRGHMSSEGMADLRTMMKMIPQYQKGKELQQAANAWMKNRGEKK